MCISACVLYVKVESNEVGDVTVQRETSFAELVECVRSCRSCARMDSVQRVLGWGNGPLNPKVMFVGEAPGRLGAEQTGLPFHGDVAGHNFEKLLSASGLSRNEVFITNAVLCNPQKEDGTNDTPTRTEITNCARHLEAQIKLVEPKIVAPLGAKALAALQLIEPHGLTLANDVRSARLWFNRILVPLYHPGQRAMIHRHFGNQLADYYYLASLLRPARSSGAKPSVEALSLVRWMLGRRSPTSLFALHKLLFLAELEAIRLSGARLTNLYFIRQKDGPYCTDLASLTRRKDTGVELYREGGVLLVRESASEDDLFGSEDETTITTEAEGVLARLLAHCANLTDAQLKQRAYRSPPMRRMLRLEKDGQSCLNRPLLTEADVEAIIEKHAA